jgi:hypothetical protein
MERENEEEDVSIYPKENRIYWNLKREALNYTLWRIDFERGWRLILLLCKE